MFNIPSYEDTARAYEVLAEGFRSAPNKETTTYDIADWLDGVVEQIRELEENENRT